MQPRSNKRVFIVEDSEDIGRLIKVYLESEGYEVSSALNGKEALSLLKEMPAQPAVILLDLMMPIMDGYEFRLHQTNDPKLSPIPVIVMTAGQDVQAKARKIGAKGYLKKPLDISDLLGAVERFCS